LLKIKSWPITSRCLNEAPSGLNSLPPSGVVSSNSPFCDGHTGPSTTFVPRTKRTASPAPTDEPSTMPRSSGVSWDPNTCSPLAGSMSTSNTSGLWVSSPPSSLLRRQQVAQIQPPILLRPPIFRRYGLYPTCFSSQLPDLVHCWICF